jgi:hypothetical protein
MPTGPGAFAHQHGDPRSLAERIEAQLGERIEEAAEMAALELLVGVRQKAGHPAPEEDNPRDRAEWVTLSGDLLAHVRATLRGELGEADRAAMDAAEAAGTDVRSRVRLGQVILARRLPDYWQRFDTARLAYFEAQLGATSTDKGWLRRLLGP